MIEAIVSSGLAEPTDLAVDWMGGNLYWCDRLSGKVEVSKLNGSYRRVLLNGLVYPKLLEVNPLLGYAMYMHACTMHTTHTRTRARAHTHTQHTLCIVRMQCVCVCVCVCKVMYEYSYNSVLYVVTGSATIEVYRMDGQGGVIKRFTDYNDYFMTSLTIDYGSDDSNLYFIVGSGSDDPRYLTRIDHNFVDSHNVIDFHVFQFPLPIPPPAVHDFIYLKLKNSGISTFFKTGGIYCFGARNTGHVYSTKVLHYDRQPGECYIF